LQWVAVQWSVWENEERRLKNAAKPSLPSHDCLFGLEETVMSVAAYALKVNFRRYENWENAILASGLLALGGEAETGHARKIFRNAVETQSSAGQLAFNLIVPGAAGNAVERWSGKRAITGATHSATMGRGVLHFRKLDGEQHYMRAAQRQYEYLCTLPRVSNGGIAHREEGRELWVDSMWFIIPFLAEYGVVAAEPAALEEAALQIRAHADRLRDPRSGLFRHIWCETPDTFPQSTFWSRGNGWVITSFVDSYEFFPAAHPVRKELCDLTSAIADRLVELQDGSGFWANTLDDRLTPMESSGTLMLGYGLRKALDLGMIEGERYQDAAARAMAAAMQAVNDEGGVEYVTLPPGGPAAPLGVAPYGQGWFLLAASQFLNNS
jgi:unsaturated rhamnogalacturonyl hydrolase